MVQGSRDAGCLSYCPVGAVFNRASGFIKPGPVGAVFNRASGFVETQEVPPTGCALGKRAYRWSCRDSHVPVGAVFNRASGFIEPRRFLLLGARLESAPTAGVVETHMFP